MKRLIPLLAIVLMMPSLASAQTGKVEQQVLQAEKDRFAAMIKGDRPALEKLLADDLTYTHSSALFESKEQFIKSVTSGNIDYVSIVPSESDWKVRVNGNTADCQRRRGGQRDRHGQGSENQDSLTRRSTPIAAAAGSCRRGRRRDFRKK